jgi:hypothetical protein
MRTLLLALVLAACGGGSKSPATPKGESTTCAAVADAMLAPLTEGKEQTKAMLDKKEELAGTIRTRCDEDAWGDQARGCFTSAKTLEAVDACSAQLTDDQRAKLNATFGGSPPEAGPAAAPPAEAPEKTMKSRKAGDPCDGGE